MSDANKNNVINSNEETSISNKVKVKETTAPVKDELLASQNDSDPVLHAIMHSIVLPPRYQLMNRGKVRDTYINPDDPEQLIMIASNRISTHDVVHKSLIPGKGKALTQVSNFWSKYLEEHEDTRDIPNQMIPDAQFPEDFPEEYKEQTIIVKKLNPFPVEAIMRGYLYGSVLSPNKDGKSYDPETGLLPTGEFIGKGLQKCSKLTEPTFTPSTKGKVDININFENMFVLIEERLEKEHPELKGRGKVYADQIKDYTTRLYTTAANYTASKGIILADTKYEFAFDKNGMLYVIDEINTPDSSRYWKEGFKEGDEPESLDKQPVRDYVMGERKTKNQTKEKPPMELPEDVIANTQARYQTMEEAFK